MPSQTRSPTTSVAPAQDTAPTTDTAQAVTQARGNDAAQDQLPAGGDSGLANYQAALGEFLGEKLYGAVSDALTFEKVQGYGHQALNAAISAAVKSAGGWDKLKSDPAALDALVTMLEKELDPMVDGWLAGDGGKKLQQTLSGWVGAHPRTVVLTALLAAAGAVLANVDIPTLKQNFNVGGAKAEVEADLGKIRALALKKVRGKISWTSGPLMGAVEVTHQGGETSGTATLGDDKKSVTLSGTMDGDGLKVAGVHGAINASGAEIKLGADKQRGTAGVLGSLSIVRHDGQSTLTDDYHYNTSTGVLTLGKTALTQLGDGMSMRTSVGGGTDGSSSMGVGVSQGDGKNGFSLDYSHVTSAYELSTEDKLKLGFHYTRSDLTALLDASVSTGTKGTSADLSGKFEKDLGDGYSMGGNARAVLGNESYLEAGAFYGFRSKEEFKSFLVTYRGNTKTQEHALGVTVEQKLESVYLRFTQSVVLGTDGNKLESSVLAGKPLNDHYMLVGGLDYTKNFTTGQNKFVPGIGVQRDKVQVMFTYDPQEKAGMIKLGIPF